MGTTLTQRRKSARKEEYRQIAVTVHDLTAADAASLLCLGYLRRAVGVCAVLRHARRELGGARP